MSYPHNTPDVPGQITPCTLTILAAFFCGALIAGTAGAAEDDSLPNFVMIVSDDQGWKDIGYHDSDVLTPTLDRLAAEGVRLENHYVYPTCSPTRVALLTGRNPSRYGVRGPLGNRQHLPPGTVTLAGALKTRGYSTAAVGKWHLGFQLDSKANPASNFDGKLRVDAGPTSFGFDCTYGYFRGQVDPYTHNYKFGYLVWQRQEKLVDEEGHATDLIAREAVRFVEQEHHGPFFLYVAFSVPHYPLDEPPQWMAKYEGRIEDPSRRVFAASLTHMDDAIGRIVAALDRTGRRSNTMIVFTSDNGGQRSWNSKTQYGGRYPGNPVLGNNLPLRGWKGSLYEGGVRVPAFVHWPGRLEPGTSEAVVCAQDWFPTLAHLAGCESTPELRLEGINLWPVLTGRTSAASRDIYWRTGRRSAIRSGDWKLIATHGKTTSYELFNMAADPLEKTELSADHPQHVDRLKTLLARQRELDLQ